MKHLIPAIVLAGLAFALPGAAGASPIEGAPRVTPPVVLDANGKLVGRYVYSLGYDHEQPIALFDDDGTLTELPIIDSPGSSLLTFHALSALYHTSTDCSGATYIYGPTMGVRTGAVVASGHQKFDFYLADNDNRESLMIQSEGTPADCSRTNTYLNELYVTSSPPLDLNALFKLPLHMR